MTRTNTLIAAMIAVGSIGFASQASAVSLGVKIACAKDYYAYCAMHKPGSKGVRTCMRANGHKLSSRCIKALRSAGLVPKTAVAKR